MTHRVLRSILALSLAGVPLVGCKAQPKEAEPGSQLTELGQRTQEAERLAGLAQKAMNAGHADKAIDLYRQSIEYSAEFPDVWNNLGLLLLEKGDLQKAMSSFSMAAELDPTDPRAFYNMGVTHMRAQWAEDAIDDFRKALAITPSYLPALRGAIQAADMLGRAENEDLEFVKRALLTETDEQWRAYFERQRYLIDSRIKSSHRFDVPSGD
ncbi:MAG: tetratricopeptide repeat protein [Phycisphaeraceae bacterium]|nr:MAG: tetratricopeptide repeat protein [Phycisphaeraceae bacterium]